MLVAGSALQITTDIVGNILEAVVEAVVPSLPTTEPISKAIRYATPRGLVATYRAVVRTSPPGEIISAALGKINIQQVSEQVSIAHFIIRCFIYMTILKY